jgi:hypothetical protein
MNHHEFFFLQLKWKENRTKQKIFYVWLISIRDFINNKIVREGNAIHRESEHSPYLHEAEQLAGDRGYTDR